MNTNIVVGLLVLCAFSLFAQAKIFTIGSYPISVTPKNQVPVITHVPSFAQDVLISVSMGFDGAQLRSIWIPSMKTVSSYNFSNLYDDDFPVVDDVGSLSAIIISGLSRKAHSYEVNSQTGEITFKGQHVFPGTPVSLGRDITTNDDNSLTFYCNSTLYYVSLSSRQLLLEVDQGTQLQDHINYTTQLVHTGFSMRSKQQVVLQMFTEEENFYVYYDSTTGRTISGARNLTLRNPDYQSFVPTNGTQGFFFKTNTTSAESGSYTIQSFDLLAGVYNGPLFAVPKLLFGDDIILFERGSVLFTISYNLTRSYISQIFISGRQVLGISHMQNNEVWEFALGASESYVFAQNYGQYSPKTHSAFVLYRYNYNGSY